MWYGLCSVPKTLCETHEFGLACSKYLLNLNWELDSDFLEFTCSLLPAAGRGAQCLFTISLEQKLIKCLIN